MVVTESYKKLLTGALRAPLICLTIFLAFGCSSTGVSQEEAAEATATQPNIIFVLTDDLDYASAQMMPEIGSLLREGGLSFENAFASYPLCCPSRATILTGLYEHNHQVRNNEAPNGGFEKFRNQGLEENTIAVRLQEGGYRTALLGKYLNEYPADDPTHVPPGWNEWYGKISAQSGENSTQRLYDYAINENGEEVSYGSETEDFYTDVLSDQATEFVRRAAPEDQPFFAYVAPTAPHGPATPAERHKGTFVDEEVPRPPSFNEEDVSDKPSPMGDAQRISDQEISTIEAYYRQRLESMLAVDEMVGSLVEELEAAGELENTYIFFTSDNGFLQGEHRIRSGKNRAYEESVRVPLFVRGPGVPAGSTVENLAVNTDFAPTFAELAGVEFPADGRSLAPLLRGGEPPSWRSAVLLERRPTEVAPLLRGGEPPSWRSAVLLERQPTEEGEEGEAKGKTNKGKGKAKNKEGKVEPGGVPKARVLEPGVAGMRFLAIRTETHKYVVGYGNGESRELYDLQADPYELENVYKSADPSLVEDLEARLEALRSCSGDGCREAEDSP